MRKSIVAGNWKMNYGPLQAESFAGSLRDPLSAITGTDIVLFPPFISLYAAHRAVAGSSIQLGAQNLSDQTGGAFTGEVSAGMITELCSWVIIGHSERRQYYQETDQLVSRKTQVALDAGLTPIVCVGEHLEDREANLTERVITTQIRGSLDGLPPDQFGRVVVAYEPVWAIGTGRAASRQDADDVIAIIRALVGEMYGRPAAADLRVLYGGSVTAANIAEFAASPEIDGALIGGASLKPEFVDIARIIAEQG
ncbi:MAG TPA: triose-phosphate isomerase [Ktedonobacterales bacterium]|nr:triose-phosphate isomerase [Ktedonobacterales bacterium]